MCVAWWRRRRQRRFKHDYNFEFHHRGDATRVDYAIGEVHYEMTYANGLKKVFAVESLANDTPELRFERVSKLARDFLECLFEESPHLRTVAPIDIVETPPTTMVTRNLAKSNR